MMEDTHRDWSDLRDRVSKTETRLDSHVEQFRAVHQRIDNEVATRLWVREEMQPVLEGLAEVVHLQKNTDKRLEEFHATQNKVMQERAEREKRESEARVAAIERTSFSNVVRRGWFWIIAALGVPTMLIGTIEALRKLAELFR